MEKSKGKQILKFSAIIFSILLIIAIIGYMYIDNIASGSAEGSLPDGYTLIEANGYSFATKASGNEQDRPIILLHGFPESSVMWKKMMEDLNQAGYYTITFDQRGYSHTARPADVDLYEISHLADDVIAVADAYDLDKFHLIGHDWGCAVGWQVAADFPERLMSFAGLSVPHLDALARAYREDSLQYKASSYVRNFQVWKMPEFTLASDDYKVLKSIWSSHEQEEIDSYLSLFSQKNALTSALNWYRANFDMFAKGTNLGKVNVPTLFIWGTHDVALLRSGAEMTKDYVTDYYRFVELDAGHWLLQESYDSVFSEIKEHVGKFH